jgi:two-component system, chemotaxis family, sensor kinase CheA
MDEMDAIVKEFVVESNENLDRLDRELIELEKNPLARETLASIFRTIHSIKGATGFLGFSKLGAVAHAGESLLSRLRDGVLLISPKITTGLLALVDCIRQMLSSIDATGGEGNADFSELIENLTCLQGIGPPREVAHGSPSSPAGPSNLPPAETNPLHKVVVAAAEVKQEQTIERTNESDEEKGSPGQSQSRIL